MLKRIAITQVRLGMYITEFCGSWMDHPFWKAKFLLQNQADLDSILASDIKELWIDTSKGLDISNPNEGVSEAEITQATEALLHKIDAPKNYNKTSLEVEIQTARLLYERSKTAVVTMFSDSRMGKALNIEHAHLLVEEISASVQRHPHAFISLARLKNANDYTYLHSVAVCGLMVALARQLGLHESEVREAGLAGLFHDIGKVFIPDAILNKPGKLTDKEFAAIKTHPSIGAKLLAQHQQVSDLIIDVCLHHHEKVDGSGYPDKLDGEHISLYAKMGAVCDVYDAITSDRPYKQGWQPAQSIQKMAEWSSGHFEESIFQAFVKTVGIYPTGTLVRLASDRLGVVIEQNAKSLLRPQVKVFFSAKSRLPIPQVVVDLAKHKDKIVGRETPETWGFKNLHRLWQESS